MSEFLELTSERRNRMLYPNPTSFSVGFSTQLRTKFEAFDPVVKSFPMITFSDNLNSASTVYNVVPCEVDTTNILDEYTKLVCSPMSGLTFRKERDFYVGCVLQAELGLNPLVERKIIKYTYLGDGLGEFIVEYSLPFEPDNVYISAFNYDDTSIWTGALFLPYGNNKDNFYTGKIAQRLGSEESKEITYYFSNIKNIILSEPTSVNWNGGIPIVIRDESVKTVRDIMMLNKNYIQFESANFIFNQTNVFDYIKIVSDDLEHHLFTPIIEPYRNDDVYKILSVLDYTLSYDNSLALIGVNYIQLSSVPTFTILKDMIITLTNPETAYIVNSYDSIQNRIILTTTLLNNSVSSVLVIKSLVIEKSITLLDDAKLELLPFSYDNYAPLNYNGFKNSSEVCFEISLLNLIIPNKVLISSDGGVISQYPYLYVELSTSTVQSGHIYTNNNNAKKALFRVVITDTSLPETADYIKLNGSGMTQTIKFKPNDNLTFRITHPNGETVVFKESDLFSPSPSNPEIQVSAVFSILRV